MKLNQMFPSKYLKAADLEDREVRVTIRSMKLEELGDDEDEKPVLYFHGTEKGLVLNKTNATTIADKYGDDTDDWVGKTVVLFASTTAFQGRNVPCLRLRVPSAGGVVEADSNGLPF